MARKAKEEYVVGILSSYKDRTEIKYDTKSYKREDNEKREIMRELLRDPLVLSVRFDDVDTEEQLEGVEQ